MYILNNYCYATEESTDSILTRFFDGERVSDDKLCTALYRLILKNASYIWQFQKAYDGECIISEAVVRAFNRKTIDYAKGQCSSYASFRTCINRLLKKLVKQVAIEAYRNETNGEETLFSFDADIEGVNLHAFVSQNGDEFTQVYSEMFENMSKTVLKHRGGYIAGWFELLGRSRGLVVTEEYFYKDYAYFRELLLAYKCSGELAVELLKCLQESRKQLENKKIRKHGEFKMDDCHRQLTDYASKVSAMLRRELM